MMRGQSLSSPLEGVNNGDNIRDVEGGDWKKRHDVARNEGLWLG